MLLQRPGRLVEWVCYKPGGNGIARFLECLKKKKMPESPTVAIILVAILATLVIAKVLADHYKYVENAKYAG